MEIQLLLLHISLFTSSLLSLSCGSAVLGLASPPSLAKPNCQSHCGGIEIPYPFGIGPPDCFNRHPDFEIFCDKLTYPQTPYLNVSNSIRREVLEISLAAGTVKIKNPIIFTDCPNKPNYLQTPYLPDLIYTSFRLSERNRFTSVSCGMIASLTLNSSSEYYAGKNNAVCLSICGNVDTGIIVNHSCSGINCCQTSLFYRYAGIYNISFAPLNKSRGSESGCKYAFLVDEEWFTSNSTNTSAIAEMDDVPIVLQWAMPQNFEDSALDNVSRRDCTYSDIFHDYGPCTCSKGYRGNPYFRGGCQDINECDDPKHHDICGSGRICNNYDGGYECQDFNECVDPKRPNICGSDNTCINYDGGYTCQPPLPPPVQPINLGIIVPCSVFGVLFLITGAWWLHKVIKKRKNIKRKQKNFKLNGGPLLEKHLSSDTVNVEKIKLFDAKELEKATDRFHADRILGQGGQGTVYKGMLTDGRIVAVKKSKIGDGGEVSQFINEIVILLQINHRNVVKLLGCCLESEVPLLVYEFLPNGTLSQYIQNRDEDFPLTWEVRLRVGIEVAGALSYLHSSASKPIYHRDIKSSNILLDDKYRAKVADFGTSRSVSIDQTHLTMTHVNGTFGYLDPEYFQSSQFTDKSDVYSFGVMLAELLTGQKPITVTRSYDGRQGRSLATFFIVSMEEGRLFDILDAEVMKGGKKEEILAVAYLAKRCLNMKGKKRPTMKEITSELERIQTASRSSDARHHIAEVECVQTKIAEAWDAVSISTGSHMDTSSSSDVQTLMYFKSF